MVAPHEHDHEHDRHPTSNGTMHQTHSLFRQGRVLDDPIPNMAEKRPWPAIERFRGQGK
jgi:hypothetical protein